MITIVWIVSIMSVHGPATATVPERMTFKTVEACEAFGKQMTGRMQDWVRGHLNGDWNFPVRVEYKCGDPA